MKIIDPGHLYTLAHLDGAGTSLLRFVTRVGSNFPGNQPPAYEGSTTQEVLRALIDRQNYVDRQQPSHYNTRVLWLLREALRVLEARAASVRGDSRALARVLECLPETTYIEEVDICPTCGHLFCQQDRHR